MTPILSFLKTLTPPPVKSYVKRVIQNFKNAKREELIYRGPSFLTAEQWAFWEKNGYLVLPRFFDQEVLKQINLCVDDSWNNRKSAENPLVCDSFIGTDREKRMYFRDTPDEVRQFPYKLNDLYLVNKAVQDAITEPRLCGILADLLEGDPIVCNSLTFEKSSQQRYHFDTFYMPPPIQNRMVASWIALEDANENAGPLVYYPGSHKIPPFRFSDGRLNAIPEEMAAFDSYILPQLEARKLKVESFPAKAGDVLIWHAQLYHGGSPIKDMKLTRKSLVTHYFRANDFSASDCQTVAPGRHFMKRAHQTVKS